MGNFNTNEERYCENENFQFADDLRAVSPPGLQLNVSKIRVQGILYSQYGEKFGIHQNICPEIRRTAIQTPHNTTTRRFQNPQNNPQNPSEKNLFKKRSCRHTTSQAVFTPPRSS